MCKWTLSRNRDLSACNALSVVSYNLDFVRVTEQTHFRGWIDELLTILWNFWWPYIHHSPKRGKKLFNFYFIFLNLLKFCYCWFCSVRLFVNAIIEDCDLLNFFMVIMDNNGISVISVKYFAQNGKIEGIEALEDKW